ncbi:UPF0739 protein C1orf74 homolog [Amblyomma americanum]
MHERVVSKRVENGVPNARKGTVVCRRVAAAFSRALWTARGCKPAFLWDVNEPTDRAVADCLRLCSTTGDVRALRLGRDVLLCNVPETLRRLGDAQLKFVDVSARLRSPRVLAMPPSGVADMLSLLKRRLAEAASPPAFRDAAFADVVPADGDWNLCTAFGVLLGYPVVYWFDGGPDAANCLAMEELNVVRVRGAGRTPTEWDDVYSFSFPLTLGVELKPHVDSWWEQLRARGFELTRVDEVKCYPVVAL